MHVSHDHKLPPDSRNQRKRVSAIYWGSSGRTPSSVGRMLAMKRFSFSWHYTLVAAFEDGPGSHRLFILNDRESTPERGTADI
jgi:hypothetical protein